jgi:hypothetical protein
LCVPLSIFISENAVSLRRGLVAKLMGESELVGDRSLAPTLPLLKAAAKLCI